MSVVDRSAKGDKVLSFLNITVLVLLSVLFVYPLWHCLMASFSEPLSLVGFRGLILKPFGFSLEGYKAILGNSNLLTGYKNTLFYVVVGSVINMALTILGAYALSRKDMVLRKPITLIIVFTMYVDFGLIPSFLNIRDLHLYDSRWAIILPAALNTYNLIVMRTAFQSVPQSLTESAMIDGANDFVTLWKIILPVSKATVSVVALFYAVEHWNSWFSSSVFLRDRGKFPLQLFLREILISNSSAANAGEISSVDGIVFLDELIKYCSIVVSTVPILCIYPFVQKYFVTGVMLGSIKE